MADAAETNGVDPTPPSDLAKLPSELILAVLRRLVGVDVRNMRLMCRRFDTAITQNRLVVSWVGGNFVLFIKKCPSVGGQLGI